MDTSLFLTVVAFTLVGPFSATSGHLLGRHLRGRSSASMMRQSLVSPVRTVAVQFAWTILPFYLVVVAVDSLAMSLLTRSTNANGGLNVLLVAISTLSPIAFAAIGLCIGIVLPTRVATALLPIAAYSLTLLSSHTMFTWESSLLPVADLRADPTMTVATLAAATLAIWTALLTMALLGVAALALWWHRDMPQLKPASAACGALLLSALTLAVFCADGRGITGILQVRPDETPLCVQVSGRSACVWRGQEYLLGTYARALGEATEIAGGVATFPMAFQQGGLQNPKAWTIDVASSRPTVMEVRLSMVRGALAPLFEAECSVAERNSSAPKYGDWALDLLLGRTDGTSVVTSHGDSGFALLLNSGKSDQDRWLNFALREENVCRPASFPN